MSKLLCIIFSFLSAISYGGDLVELSDRNGYYPLNRSMGYLEDKNSQWTVDDVSSDDFQDDFLMSSDGVLNLGYTSSTYWLKVDLLYKASEQDNKAEREWLLEIDYIQLQLAELYTLQSDGSFQMISSDIRTPLVEKKVRHVNSVFIIKTKSEEIKTFYLKIKNERGALRIPLNLWDPLRFLQKVSHVELLYGLFYGSMLIMFFYHFFVFLVVRDISYFYYVLYSACALIFLSSLSPHGSTLFDSEMFFFNKDNTPILGWLAWASSILFTCSFLNTKKKHPVIHQLMLLLFFIAITFMCLSYFDINSESHHWISLASIIYVIALPCAGYVCWIQGDSSARFYVLAWLASMGGSAILVSMVLGFLPENAFTASAIQIGFVVEIALLSFAMADRIKLAQRETWEANKRAMMNLGRYQSVFNNSIEGLYQMSLTGHFISANPALVRLLGYYSEMNLKQSNLHATAVCYADEVVREAAINQLRQCGEIQRLDAEYIRQGGGLHWARHSARLIYDEQGVPSHIEGTFIDITERKEKEEAQRALDIEKVEKDTAQASTEAKSYFLANMSHEIRTPLTAIIGYSESLRDIPMSEKDRQESIGTIIRGGHHLLNLINDILDFSKIEAKKLEVESIPIDLFALVMDVQSYFSVNADAKGLAFDINYRFPLPRTIFTDPTRLKQVLLNLCSNALKFTDQGCVSIDIGYDSTKNLMRFNVSDTGVGLTEKQLGRLFQAFVQADSTTTRNHGGTGLGLIISRQLAELMGGLSWLKVRLA
jgi:PAS domain S-box-containing protein